MRDKFAFACNVITLLYKKKYYFNSHTELRVLGLASYYYTSANIKIVHFKIHKDDQKAYGDIRFILIQ